MLRFPDETVLATDPARVIARPVLILTAYLDDPAAWSRVHLGDVLGQMVELVGPDRLPLYTTTGTTQWLRVTPAEIERVVQDARVLWWRSGVRHHYGLRLADRTDAPSCGASYREVADGPSRRCGYLQLVLPWDSDPEDLLQLALAVAHTGAVHSLVGGYGYSFDPWYKSTAFWAMYRASRRYVGMDVQDPEQMALRAAEGLPGCNWLTLISEALREQAGIDRGALTQLSQSGVSVITLAQSTLLRAGERPTVGDRNTLLTFEAYAAVARVLQPAFVADLAYWGGFLEHQATGAFLQRFDQPGGWT